MEIVIALAGNPNSGKTTLFNALTGSNQYVGNWAGVTVERKEAMFELEETTRSWSTCRACIRCLHIPLKKTSRAISSPSISRMWF